MNKKSIKKVWTDPVWSTVIAAVILSLGTIIWAPVRDWIWNTGIMCLLFIQTNYSRIIIAVLIVIVIIQFVRNKKAKKSIPHILTNTPTTLSGKNWLVSLSNEDFQKYMFILWFPINHRLQTHPLFQSETLTHIPEIFELQKRKILFDSFFSAIEYVISIDKETYDYLEEQINILGRKDFAAIEKLKQQFGNCAFHMLFPKASLY